MVAHDRHHPNAWIVANDPLRIVALTDPVTDQLGHPAGSEYVETYWLPILGPSAVQAARRLVDWLDTEPDGFELSLGEFACSLGLGSGIANHAPVVRTLARLVDFGMAATGGSAYAIRRRFPPLPARYIRRLPNYLARSHQLELEVVL